jgi:hypothetical protein
MRRRRRSGWRRWRPRRPAATRRRRWCGRPSRRGAWPRRSPRPGTASPTVRWRGCCARWGLGTDHDTAAFAVATVRHWWDTTGRRRYPHADRLLICSDGGGSNGYRVRAWKVELAALAAETGLAITPTAGHQQMEQDRTSAVLPDHAAEVLSQRLRETGGTIPPPLVLMSAAAPRRSGRPR